MSRGAGGLQASHVHVTNYALSYTLLERPVQIGYFLSTAGGHAEELPEKPVGDGEHCAKDCQR